MRKRCQYGSGTEGAERLALHKAGNLSTTLHATEGRATPRTAGDKLEAIDRG